MLTILTRWVSGIKPSSSSSEKSPKEVSGVSAAPRLWSAATVNSEALDDCGQAGGTSIPFHEVSLLVQGCNSSVRSLFGFEFWKEKG